MPHHQMNPKLEARRSLGLLSLSLFSIISTAILLDRKKLWVKKFECEFVTPTIPLSSCLSTGGTYFEFLSQLLGVLAKVIPIGPVSISTPKSLVHSKTHAPTISYPRSHIFPLIWLALCNSLKPTPLHLIYFYFLPTIPLYL